MDNKKVFSKISDYIFIFTAVSIILSLWFSLFWRNSYLIFLISIILSYFISKKFSLNLEFPSRPVFIILAIFLSLIAHPLLLIHPFYTASSDAIHSTINKIFTDRIPQTYAPFSDVRFNYQIGFGLFSKIFTDLLWFVPDYIINWFIGIIFSLFFVILIYSVSLALFKQKKKAEICALLFLGTKTIFQMFYFGEWPGIVSIDFFLVTFYLFITKNKLRYLTFPTTFVIHPFASASMIMVLFFYGIFFKKTKQFFFLFPAIMLALPSLILNFLPSTSNILSSKVEQLNIFDVLSPFPLWFGIVPSVFFVIALYNAVRKKIFTREIIFIFFITLISVLLYIFLKFIQFDQADNVFMLITIFGVIFVSAGLPKFEIEKRKAISGLIIFFILASFFASKELNLLRSGSKLKLEEADFASRLKEVSPDLEKAVFISKGEGWMAHLANKIPLNVRNSHFIHDSPSQIFNDAAWANVLDREKLWKEIMNGCSSCVLEANVSIVVVNKELSGIRLDEKILLENEKFLAYKLS